MDRTGTIFLHSCSVGKGGARAKNMVNFLAKLAPGRTVIGATKPVSAKEISITSVVPFRAVMTDREGHDFTYRSTVRRHR